LRIDGIGPNFIRVGVYDGMALIYKALGEDNAVTDGDALLGP
jgi:hypothetical protein